MNFGPDIRAEWKNKENSLFGGSADFVFAFRLRIVLVYHTGNVTHVEYTERTMYDAEGLSAGLQKIPFLVESCRRTRRRESLDAILSPMSSTRERSVSAFEGASHLHQTNS